MPRLELSAFHFQAAQRIEACTYGTCNQRWPCGGVKSFVVADGVVRHVVFRGDAREVARGGEWILLELLARFRHVEAPADHAASSHVLHRRVYVRGLLNERERVQLADPEIQMHEFALRIRVHEMVCGRG